MTSQDNAIVLSPVLRERLLTTIRQRYPQKSFGYLISDVDACTPTDFILFNTNIRNSETWKTTFESYGQYFVEHEDAGFVATPEESWQVQNEIWQRGMVEVGVFHSHLRHPANFSGIDFDLHTQRFDNLWHLIISMRNPHLPQLRAFAVSPAGVRELPVLTPARSTPGGQRSQASSPNGTPEAASLEKARQLLRLDSAGLPLVTDNTAICAALGLLVSEHREAWVELVSEGFLRESAQRFAQYIAPQMQRLAGGSFQMGAHVPHAHGQHYCGETPAHTVAVSPFSIMRVPITHRLFGLFDRRRLDVPARDLQKPATGLTWFDATVFALWMGCRLPTEAEWEYACGAGSAGEWCCQNEQLLSRYAWYSENARGRTQTVGTREANAFGLYDFHGNVWEWCQDTYEQDFYARSPHIDPVNVTSPLAQRFEPTVHKVCRGGSLHALSEMCRTRYRFHEPADFLAQDLGCRLARNVDQTSTKGKTYG